MNEKELLNKTIERKLKEKGEIVADIKKTDEEALSALFDLCTLNKLRDGLIKH